VLKRSGKVGAGKENKAARREERMQKQHTQAKEDIRYNVFIIARFEMCNPKQSKTDC